MLIGNVAPLNIGGVKIKNNLILAPMAGFGDVAFRQLCLESGAGLTISEMISVKGLYYGSEKTAEMLLTSELEAPSAVQLFGGEPKFFSLAAKNPLLKKYDIIDINMGCPVNKVVKNGEGSALLKSPDLAKEIVAAAREGNRPVTVKMRIGYEDNNIVAIKFAEKMERAGAAAICVHGRTTEQMYHGKANWEIIREVKNAVSIPVIGNGDISSAPEAIRRLNGMDGVMIGRGALGHPEIFAEILSGEIKPRIEIILRHIELMQKYFSDRYTTLNMRKHISHYLKGVPDTKGIKQNINYLNDVDEMKNSLIEILRR